MNCPKSGNGKRKEEADDDEMINDLFIGSIEMCVDCDENENFPVITEKTVEAVEASGEISTLTYAQALIQQAKRKKRWAEIAADTYDSLYEVSEDLQEQVIAIRDRSMEKWLGDTGATM